MRLLASFTWLSTQRPVRQGQFQDMVPVTLVLVLAGYVILALRGDNKLLVDAVW